MARRSKKSANITALRKKARSIGKALTSLNKSLSCKSCKRRKKRSTRRRRRSRR